MPVQSKATKAKGKRSIHSILLVILFAPRVSQSVRLGAAPSKFTAYLRQLKVYVSVEQIADLLRQRGHPDQLLSTTKFSRTAGRSTERRRLRPRPEYRSPCRTLARPSPRHRRGSRHRERRLHRRDQRAVGSHACVESVESVPPLGVVAGVLAREAPAAAGFVKHIPVDREVVTRPARCVLPAKS